MLSHLHHRFVHRRRVATLAECLASLIPPRARALDIGAGDGLLAAELLKRRPDIRIIAVEVLYRSRDAVPIVIYDGVRLPFADSTFDVTLLIDVLHHTDAPGTLLAEAARVAGQFLLIKDHVANSALDRHTLRLMDWVGNARHGVALPYKYLSADQWETLFHELSLQRVEDRSALGLYMWPLSVMFERHLHMLVTLRHEPSVRRLRADHSC